MKLNWKVYTITSLFGLMIIAEFFIIGKYWWWNIIATFPPVFLLSIPVLVVLLAIKERQKWFYFLTAVIMAVIIIPRADLNIRIRFHKPVQVQKSIIKVFAWNTNVWDQRDKHPGLYNFLKQQDSDIYILQEYTYSYNGILQPIDRTCELKAVFPGFNFLAAGQFLIISRYPVIGHELSKTQQVLKADLMIDGQELSIINVHLEPHLTFTNPFTDTFWKVAMARDKIRREGLLEIENFMKKTSGRPLIVEGDFNTSVLMGGFDRIKNRLNDAVIYSDAILPVTWEMWGMGWRLDYFLHDKSTAVLSYQTVAAEGLSDHKGILVTITI